MDTLDNFGSSITLKERVYRVLKTEIILGRLKPGERLNILDLSTKLNISGAPVREALSMLSRDGLVELEPHKRPVVAVGSIEDFKISAELRKMLEPYATKLSVKKIPQEKIDEVRKQLQRVIDNPTDLPTYVESDMAVHELLHSFAGSKILSDTLSNIKTYTMRYRYLVEKIPGEAEDLKALAESIIISTKEHMAIIDALDTRDAQKAYDAVLSHLNSYIKRNKLTSTGKTKGK
jgi:DNA-binding GntR family transcriptional regulator